MDRIPIKEYDYKPEPKEIAEAKGKPIDFSFVKELRVIGVVDIIFENVVETRRRLNEIEAYGIASENIASLKEEIKYRKKLGEALPQLYEQIPSDDYRDEVHRALDNFKVWNKTLMQKLGFGIMFLRSEEKNRRDFRK